MIRIVGVNNFNCLDEQIKMSKNPSALASLTANYTDSENEDGHDSDDNSPQTEESNESQVFVELFSHSWNPNCIAND